MNVSAVMEPLGALDKLAGMIGAMGLPLALLCVGAELDLSRLQGQKSLLVAMSF